MSQTNDKELLKRYKEGNRNYAFNLITRKHQERLYWHVRRMVISHEDADDILQETFIKAWNGLKKFKQILSPEKALKLFIVEHQLKIHLFKKLRHGQR